MLKIDKAVELQEFVDFKKTHPKQWDEIESVPGLKKILREYLLEHEQKINGSYCCVYCERKITLKASHIEHIKPKSVYNADTFNYQNLTVSCQEEDVVVSNQKIKLKTGKIWWMTSIIRTSSPGWSTFLEVNALIYGSNCINPRHLPT